MIIASLTFYFAGFEKLPLGPGQMTQRAAALRRTQRRRHEGEATEAAFAGGAAPLARRTGHWQMAPARRLRRHAVGSAPAARRRTRDEFTHTVRTQARRTSCTSSDSRISSYYHILCPFPLAILLKDDDAPGFYSRLALRGCGRPRLLQAAADTIVLRGHGAGCV